MAHASPVTTRTDRTRIQISSLTHLAQTVLHDVLANEFRRLRLCNVSTTASCVSAADSSYIASSAASWMSAAVSSCTALALCAAALCATVLHSHDARRAIDDWMRSCRTMAACVNMACPPTASRKRVWIVMSAGSGGELTATKYQMH